MTFTQFLWAFVTWLTVIVGWMVVADQQNYRELRKDRSSRLNDLRSKLLDVEHQAVDFHTADAFSESGAFILRRELGSLARELTILKDCKFIDMGCLELMVALRQACTEMNDTEVKFQKQVHFSERIGEIMAAREALDDRLSAGLTDALLSNKSIWDSLNDMWIQSGPRLQYARDWIYAQYRKRYPDVDR